MYSILQTAKFNGVNPQAYLTDTLSRIAAGHPINRISELMPWAFRPRDQTRRLITADTERLPRAWAERRNVGPSVRTDFEVIG